MNFNKDKNKESDVLEEMNSLAEKFQALQELIKQGNSAVSNELQDIQVRLTELIENQEHRESQQIECSKFSSDDYREELYKHIDRIFKKDEKDKDVWFSKKNFKNNPPPPFITIPQRPMREGNRSTRFISFINFKGGVGKTTLTGNLAAAFASGNYRDSNNQSNPQPLRVLVVDLDFQGTLSDRCAEYHSLQEAFASEKTSASLLKQPKSLNITLEDLVLNMEKTDNAFIIPTVDDLDSADNEHFVRLAFDHRDIRYCYRLWFHQNKVFESYDLVIFDCPPRITASSICALMVSDFVFIPTAPESFDKYSVIRTMSWLLRFKYELNLPLKIGGIVLNRIQSDKAFTSQELEFKYDLTQNIEFVLNDPKYGKRYLKECGIPTLFESYVPKRQGRVSINGEHDEPLPGSRERKKAHPYFTEVATELYERIYQ